MQPLRLLVALRTRNQFDREAFLSIATQALTYSNIFLHVKHEDEPTAFAASATDAQAIIASVSNPREIESLAAIGLPCVNIANYLQGHHLVPVVGNDDQAVGRMAAEYFLERGFAHFAYFCDSTNAYFFPRRDAFAAAVRDGGFECHMPPPLKRIDGRFTGADNEDATTLNTRHSAAWLASLPKPLAVFSPYDYEARQAMHACQLANLAVPDEVSIIGVDNDPMLCLTVSPQIASVATAAAAIGRAALELVQAMVQGRKRPPAKPLLIAPTEVVVRGSCSEQAINDRDVAAAVNFIRTHVRERLTIAEVANHVAVSRRTLERRFMDVLRRSPAEELRRARIAQAKRLLSESDLTLPEVARRSGLIRPQRLANVLKEECGLTPLQYREKFRREGHHGVAGSAAR